MSTTRLLAKFTYAAEDGDLGPDARLRVREHVKDCLGVAIAAAAEPPAAIIQQLLRVSAAQDRGSFVLGADVRTNAWDAAWANGSLCHLLDFDDYGHGHPTAVVLPAALAAAELRESSGPEFVLALAVGWDVFERLSNACRGHERAMRRQGIHPTAVYGGPAAAATAGKLLGLEPPQIAIAMGLAASASTGLTEQFGTWGKGVQAGNSARAGVIGALLAEQGYQGSDTAIEGDHGLLSVFAGNENVDLSQIERDRGVWAICDPGVSIKRYPACGGTLRGIDAALEIRAAAVADPLSIERIDVEISESMLDSLHIDRPEHGFEGKFSIRFCVAAALADGNVSVASFADESLRRPVIQQLMDRLNVRMRPGGYVVGPETYRTPVTVTLSGGTVITREIAEPRGNTKNRMSADELTEKFVACGLQLGTAAQVDRVNDAIEHLDSISVHELLAALSALGA